MKSVSFPEIPVIDFSSARSGGCPGDIATEISAAAEGVGFLEIVGHGIEPDLIATVAERVASLEASSESYKSSLASPTGHPFRGFSVMRDDAGRRTVDRFQVNWFDGPEEAQGSGVDERYDEYFHPNVWPREIEGFEEDWRRYFVATQSLGDQVMRVFAYALGLEQPEDRFGPNVLSPPVSDLAANIYPSRRETGVEPGAIIFREHTDSGTLTLLYQQGDYSGLEVRTVDGRWITVPLVEGAYIINLGELMARWTNGRWRATPHRVVAAQDLDAKRLSLTTFHLPRVDQEIAPFPECVGPGGPEFGSVTPFEWEAIFLSSYRR